MTRTPTIIRAPAEYNNSGQEDRTGSLRTQRERARSALVRSRRTNDPLALPVGVSGVSTAGRRWRDLVGAYAAQLGERIRREDVRALVGSLVSLTLISERLQADVARGEHVDPNHVIQVSQTIVQLLKELGVAPATSHASVPDTEHEDREAGLIP